MNRRRFVATTLSTAAALSWLAGCSDKTPDSTAAPAPAAAKPDARASYEMAGKGSGFTVGAMMAANTVYVFFDPTCPHCAALWMASRPLLTRLKMVWMPISLLRGSSAAQGATILAAPDPAAAMTENETSVLNRGGGITANRSVGEDVVAKVQANTDLFSKLGADSVPYIVYRNAKTGQYGTYAGQLETEQLAAMVGA